ncbi:MAG: hypothetical protein KIT84_38115 [Labilithrix sp.]|nr:hypothetical protein [Labilithrix sp.]MCW5816875.1 hypothetical protein [Labilithrix sp.]
MRPLLCASSVLVLAACAAKSPPPAEATVAAVPPQAAEPIPPADAPRADRFPAGPGVTLVHDQLTAVFQDRTLFDPKVSHEVRLAGVRKALGVQGETRKYSQGEAVAFAAIGPKWLYGPWGCNELVLRLGVIATWSLGPANMRVCGLPYAEDHTKTYVGPGPLRTVLRLEQMRAEIGDGTGAAAQAIAKAKLGRADAEEGGDAIWTAIGARDADAPVTCWLLRVGAKSEVTKAPLETCGLAWGPPPAARFDAGPPVPFFDKPAALAECAAKCSAKEMCLLEQRVPAGATLRDDPDGPRARYPDGYPARAELVARCTPVPATCAKPDAACFFGKPPAMTSGPCPADRPGGGHSFLTTPSPHITCFVRVGEVSPSPSSAP